MTSFILKEFQFIDKKLKQKEYESFEDYEKELKIFHSYYSDNAPEFANKPLIILDFLYRALLEGINHLFPTDLKASFIRSEDLSTTSKEKTTIIRSSLDKVLSEQKTFNNDDLLEKELRELRRDYDLLKLENKRLEAESQGFLALKYKLVEYDDVLKGKSRDSLFVEAEYKKEMALLKQKLEFTEKNNEELSKKGKDHFNDIKSMKSSHYNEIKELTLKYETLNRSLDFELKQNKDRLHDLQIELETANEKLHKEKENFNLSESHYKSIIQENNQTIKSLRKDVQELRNKELEKSEKMKTIHEKNLEELNEKLKNVEENCRIKEKAIKELKMVYERDKAVLTQKNEFLEFELKEFKSKNSENSNIQNAFLKALELSEDYAKNPKNDELSDKIKQEIRVLEDENRILKAKSETKEREIEELKRFKSKDYEEIKRLQAQIIDLKSHNELIRIEATDSNALLTMEIERLMGIKEALEGDYMDLKGRYAKDQASWNEKIQSLSEELNDSERKFHLALRFKDEESYEKCKNFQINEMIRKKTSFLESHCQENNRKSPLSTLSSLNSLTSFLEIPTKREPKASNLPHNNDILDLEKEGLKNRIYELEQALNDSEARREIQRSELKREKSKQNLNSNDTFFPEGRVLRKSTNVYNTLNNPITTPKNIITHSVSTMRGGRSPHINENFTFVNNSNKKFSLHSKKPSFSEKPLLNLNEGNAYNKFTLADLMTHKNIERSFVLNAKNASSLEEQEIFDLKRIK